MSLGRVTGSNEQYGMCLPRHSIPDSSEVECERLAEAVERFNSETDPAVRIALINEIRDLRSRINGAPTL